MPRLIDGLKGRGNVANEPAKTWGEQTQSCVALVTSLVAIAVAIASLVVAMQQCSEVSKYHKLTLEPMLSFVRVFGPTEGYESVGIYVQNVGHGTARIVDGSADYGEESLEHSDGPLACPVPQRC